MFPNVFLADLNLKSNVVHHGKRLTFYRNFHATVRQLLGILVHILFPCIKLCIVKRNKLQVK